MLRRQAYKEGISRKRRCFFLFGGFHVQIGGIAPRIGEKQPQFGGIAPEIGGLPHTLLNYEFLQLYLTQQKCEQMHELTYKEMQQYIIPLQFDCNNHTQNISK